ncbi:MAG: helix-turn-helix domain-containing protein [Acidimicrobiales bacterium]
MTTRAHLRPTHGADLHAAAFPFAVVPFAGMLSSASPSTSAGLGMAMPTIRGDIENQLGAAGEVTTAAALMVDKFWGTYLSTTETGITHIAVPRPSSEEVRRLRDEISRRTRLTRQQIARAIGVDRRSLTSWVNSSSVPGPDRLERLRFLAALVREIDALKPGRATKVVLARRRGGDILDLVADGRFAEAQNWHAMVPGVPSVRVTRQHPAPRKPPLHAAALAAFRSGQLSVPPRARTIREGGDYEQDFEEAETIFPDESPAPRRGRYR